MPQEILFSELIWNKEHITALPSRQKIFQCSWQAKGWSGHFSFTRSKSFNFFHHLSFVESRLKHCWGFYNWNVGTDSNQLWLVRKMHPRQQRLCYYLDGKIPHWEQPSDGIIFPDISFPGLRLRQWLTTIVRTNQTEEDRVQRLQQFCQHHVAVGIIDFNAIICKLSSMCMINSEWIFICIINLGVCDNIFVLSR